MFHWYGSGGHQWLVRKTEATETSKASVDRSYGNGNYVGSLRLLKKIIRKRGQQKIRPLDQFFIFYF